MLGHHLVEQTVWVSFLDTGSLHKKFELLRTEFHLDGAAVLVSPREFKVTVVSQEKAGLRTGGEFQMF